MGQSDNDKPFEVIPGERQEPGVTSVSETKVEFDVWDAIGFPVSSVPTNWTFGMVEGKGQDGSTEYFGLVTFVSLDTAMRVMFGDQGFDNLIKFLEKCRAEVKQKNDEAKQPGKPQLAVAKSQLIIPGRDVPMPPTPRPPA